ncbi:MAG: hypothetical protein LUH58_08595 [Lachnospiraceae bacterium]|nr:hypothetical protein [Lachnospiraceae bacterium]
MDALDRLYIGLMCRAYAAKQKVSDFMKSEMGVSNIVATIIILLIVVLIIGVFWSRLSGWLNDMMDNIFNYSPSTSGANQL